MKHPVVYESDVGVCFLKCEAFESAQIECRRRRVFFEKRSTMHESDVGGLVFEW